MTPTQELELQSALDYDPAAEFHEYSDGTWAIVEEDRATIYDRSGYRLAILPVREQAA